MLAAPPPPLPAPVSRRLNALADLCAHTLPDFQAAAAGTAEDPVAPENALMDLADGLLDPVLVLRPLLDEHDHGIRGLCLRFRAQPPGSACPERRVSERRVAGKPEKKANGTAPEGGHVTTVDRHTSVLTSPVTAAVARDAVRKLLSRYRPPVGAETVADALLVTSELTTNALRHAGGITVFGCVVRGNRLEITVEDASPALPTARPPGDPSTPGGHGWPMVCTLASEVTVSALPGGGKRIRALLRLS